MDVYKQGEVEVYYFCSEETKITEFTEITKTDIIKQQFSIEYGVHGEPAIDLVNVNGAILTITMPQMSDETEGFETAFKIQLTGIVGVMLMLRTPKKDIVFPVCFLQGRPDEIYGKNANYFKYTIISTDQWSIPKITS